MNVCFENLIPGQPVYITGICICILVIDLILSLIISKVLITFDNILDLVVIVGLVISFSLYKTYKSVVYLQVIGLLKIKDLFLINTMVYELVKKYNVIFKTYVVLKIFYWVLLVGHILGCIFYAVDLYLIKT